MKGYFTAKNSFVAEVTFKYTLETTFISVNNFWQHLLKFL